MHPRRRRSNGNSRSNLFASLEDPMDLEEEGLDFLRHHNNHHDSDLVLFSVRYDGRIE